MARLNTGAIEGEIDRLGSLDLEELRREWRQPSMLQPAASSNARPFF
jgi:hypothetical protein